MPTDIDAFRAGLIEERAKVQELLDLVDVADEQSRFDAAQTTFTAAKRQFEKAARRYGLVDDHRARLRVLDAQIDLVTP